MAISPASTIPASASTTQASANVNIEDFLKILTAQLNNQDPLKPVDNQEFVAQIAQFANLEQTREMNEKLDQMLSAQSSTQSLGVLGKDVDVNIGGARFTGTVTSLSLASGQPLLTVTPTVGAPQTDITMSQIINIINR